MPGHAELVGDESASISSFSHNLELLLKHLAAISATHPITPSMGPVLPGNVPAKTEMPDRVCQVEVRGGKWLDIS